jgi:hypothetical protein
MRDDAMVLRDVREAIGRPLDGARFVLVHQRAAGSTSQVFAIDCQDTTVDAALFALANAVKARG